MNKKKLYLGFRTDIYGFYHGPILSVVDSNGKHIHYGNIAKVDKSKLSFVSCIGRKFNFKLQSYDERITVERR